MLTAISGLGPGGLATPAHAAGGPGIAGAPVRNTAPSLPIPPASAANSGSYGLSGHVIEDADGNGSWSPGETGLDGQPVHIVAVDEAGVAHATVTASDGSWWLSGLPAGDFTVTAELAPGHVGTGPVRRSRVAAGSNCVNFFQARPVTVGGTVYDDANLSASQDAGEGARPDVAVLIRSTRTGEAAASPVLRGDGRFEASLPPGGYTVTVGGRGTVGAVVTEGQLSQLVPPLAEGAVAVPDVVGLATSPDYGGVSGVVFGDDNRDGGLQAGESVRYGALTVSLTGPGGYVAGTVSRADGTFCFPHVVPGTYALVVLPPSGTAATNPGRTVEVVAGMTSAGQDLGLRQVGSVSGLVFDDHDGDRLRSSGEGAPPGGPLTVRLNPRDGGPVLTTTSDPVTGAYLFPDAPTGPAERVGVVRRPGLVRTSQPHLFSVSAGARTTGIDLGVAQTRAIAGRVFDDANGDGIRGAAETGLAGVPVELQDCVGKPLASTLTDQGGGYVFPGRRPGSFRVLVQPSSGSYAVTARPNPVNVVLTDLSDVEVADTGEQERTGSLSGTVFDDANGNGTRDSGEVPLAGQTVSVSVSGASGRLDVVPTSDGSWSVDTLPAGEYTVSVSAAPGYLVTTAPVSATIDVSAGPAVVDLGEARPVTVSGHVYDDADGSGTRGATEAGRPDTLVTIRSAGGVVVSPPGLGPELADGAFTVGGLLPGSYTVEVGGAGVQAPAIVTEGLLHTALAPLTEGSEATVEVGVADPVTLNLAVYDDANADGTQDPGEGVDPAVTVTLDGPAGSRAGGRPVALTPAGTAALVLPPGTYTVQVAGAAAQVQTQTSPSQLTLLQGQAGSFTAGYYTPGGLSGRVFDDASGTGSPTDAEGPPTGVTAVDVCARPGTPGPCRLAPVDPHTGGWSVGGLAPGDYSVRIVGLPPGYLQSASPYGSQAGGVSIPVAEGGTATDAEGFVRPGTLTGSVYDDADGDGTRGPGEGAFAGATVSIADLGRATPPQRVDVVDGAWSVTGLLPGRYAVLIGGTSGAVHTQDTVGDPVVVTEGSATALPNGFFVPAEVSGEVFEDANGNGVRDAGESGIDGRLVTVTGSDGRPRGTATTAGGGLWRIGGLPAGTVTMSTVAPGNGVRTTPDVTVALSEGQRAAAVDLGTQERDARISGLAFADANGDGARNSVDGGISGLGVTVRGVGGGVAGRTTTGYTGEWSVTGLAAGSYQVTVDPPPGSTLTTSGRPSGADPATVVVAAGAAAAPLLTGFRGPDLPPVFAASANNTSQTIESGAGLAPLTASDPNGDPLQFTVVSGALPPGVALAPSGVFTGAATNAGTQPLTFGPVVIVVSDGHGGTATTSLTVTVLPGADSPPVAVADATHTAPGVAVEVHVLANDTDPNGDPLALVSFSQGVRGSEVVCTAAGVCTVTPGPLVLSGQDTFGYTISDGRGGTAGASVTVTIDNVKPVFTSAPVNTAQSVTVGQGLLPVTATDGNADPVTFTLVSGTLPPGITGLSGGGSFGGVASTPGRYEVVIAADDGHAGGDVATTTLVITVSDVSPLPDHRPVANPDSYPAPGDPPVLPGRPVTLPVLANDTDADSDPLTIIAFDTPTPGGTLALSATGDLIYTPRPGFIGTDTFTYTVSDGKPGGTDVGIVTVVVSAPTDAAPMFTDAAANSQQTVTSGSPLSPLSARDPDTDPALLRFSVVAGALPIGVSLEPVSGAFAGVPINVGLGPATYPVTVQVSDGTLINAVPQRLVITVLAQPKVNRPPIALPDAAVTAQGAPVTIAVLQNDSDPDGNPITVTGADATSVGGGTVSCSPDGDCVYAPRTGFTGDDTFTYTVSDGMDSVQGTVTVTVSPGPAPTVHAGDDLATTTPDTPVTIAVAVNDTDSAGLSLTAVLATPPTHGAATCSGSACTYTPTPGSTGNDSFTYTVSDARGGRATATVTVSVRVPSGPSVPTIHTVPDLVSMTAGTTVRIVVAGNDTDSAGLALSVVLVAGARHGLVTCAAASCTYTPNVGYSGTDSFSYGVSDGSGGVGTSEVTVTVIAPPVLPPPPVQLVIVAGSVTAVIPVGVHPAAALGGTVVRVSGRLAPGLTLNPDGRFTGGATRPGTYDATVTIRVRGEVVTRRLTVRVVATAGPVTTGGFGGSGAFGGSGGFGGFGGLPGDPGTTSGLPPATLAFTGGSPEPGLSLGMGLIALGSVCVGLGRRRRRVPSPGRRGARRRGPSTGGLGV